MHLALATVLLLRPVFAAGNDPDSNPRSTETAPTRPSADVVRTSAPALNIPNPARKEIAPATALEFGGYPLPMGFRRMTREALPELLHQDAAVASTAERSYRETEAIAIEFKRLKPEAFVRVQYFWDAFPRVLPHSIAKKINFRLLDDPVFYAFPKFNGFYLALYPAKILQDIADVDEAEFLVSDISGWMSTWQKCRGRKRFPFAIIYALDEQGAADFTRSEFVQIASVNLDEKRVRILRLHPKNSPGRHAYAAGRARIGIQSLTANNADMWYPNLSRFCPRDPETGMNAAEYWAKHIATYFRRRLAPLDGLAFDVPPFAPHRGSDIDNDGLVDHGYSHGINYLGLGLYDFFDFLKNGSRFHAGLGPDVLVSADGEEMADQRFPDVTNGAENEDFPGYMDFTRFPEQLNLHRWWCERALTPNVSYPVMRFPTDAYHNRKNTDRLLPWMHNNFARLGIAAACFGNGIVAYESSRVWADKKLLAIQEGDRPAGGELIETRPYYIWDEYNAGTRNQFRWLGPPSEPVVFRKDHLGEELLTAESFGRWDAIKIPDPNVALTGEEFMARDRRLSAGVIFRGTPMRPWTGESGPGGPERLERAASVIFRSPRLPTAVGTGDEFSISFVGLGRSIYRTVDPKYEMIPLCIGFRIRMETGETGVSQWVYLDNRPWRAQLSVTAPAAGAASLEILAGVESGGFELRDFSLRAGCAEVGYRRFPRGLVLMNGSAREKVVFDLALIDPDGRYRRIDGVVDPVWNTGQPVEGRIELPAREALFLVRGEFPVKQTR